MSDVEKVIKNLVGRAAEADPIDALQLTQAALNAAHAAQVLITMNQHKV